MSIFSQRLKALRIERGLTLKTISLQFSLPLTTYAGYEQGVRQPPIELIVEFCNFFDVSADYLIGRVDYY